MPVSIPAARQWLQNEEKRLTGYTRLDTFVAVIGKKIAVLIGYGWVQNQTEIVLIHCPI